ncbi:transporter substrate-binding domain-containing protein [Marinobacter sp. ATCH36]|uniref:substrate-binding periplasmic protein n=1 Tax=Marinobacter sp. ATCH36 TaxID=2945106 RepID=UPI00202235A2|nr:transporter substrate-binding domain-containing protein [Marinobacter sp. ATCH36]MCL7942592.1 amino acid ABC transporter substrate-binding protein [Marinobacter sp. ATCH36]
MKTALLLLSLPVTLGLSVSASSETEITVGVYDFPPVAAIRDNSRLNGLLGDLLAEMESTHQDISFRIVHTSPKRRHLDFEAGLYDVIFFESLDWGWESRPIEATHPVLSDEDVYVALKKPGRDQRFFDNITDRRIAAISGYHYGFAGLSTNDAELEKRFQVEFSQSHERNLKLIKADRPSVAEVAVISHAYLRVHLERNPEDKDRFLVSDMADQMYLLRILTREDGPVSAETLEQLLSPIIQDGRYQQMVERHGLQIPPELPGY